MDASSQYAEFVERERFRYQQTYGISMSLVPELRQSRGNHEETVNLASVVIRYCRHRIETQRAYLDLAVVQFLVFHDYASAAECAYHVLKSNPNNALCRLAAAFERVYGMAAHDPNLALLLVGNNEGLYDTVLDCSKLLLQATIYQYYIIDDDAARLAHLRANAACGDTPLESGLWRRYRIAFPYQRTTMITCLLLYVNHAHRCGKPLGSDVILSRGLLATDLPRRDSDPVYAHLLHAMWCEHVIEDLGNAAMWYGRAADEPANQTHSGVAWCELALFTQLRLRNPDLARAQFETCLMVDPMNMRARQGLQSIVGEAV